MSLYPAPACLVLRSTAVATDASPSGVDASTAAWSPGLRCVVPVDFAVSPSPRSAGSRSSRGETISIAGPRPCDDDDSGLLVGVGALWRVNDPFGIGAGQEWFDFEGDADGASKLAAGIHFRAGARLGADAHGSNAGVATCPESP